MQEDSRTLILGSKVVFNDTQTAKLEALEVEESWEILNIVVARGFLRWKESVRLPFTTATRWSEKTMQLSCGSREAFAREVPPIAAPARPISIETPVALTEGRLLGALVNPTTRQMLEAILKHGNKRIRVAASDLSFEGKVLHVTTTPETLPEYRTDEEMAQEAWRRLSHSRLLSPVETRLLEVESSGGVLTVTGNVRRKQSRLHIDELLRDLPGASRIDNRVADDIELETDLGWALERAGVQRSASIYARSSMGNVTLFGRAPSARVVEDAVRAASEVDGVRSVTNRVELGTQPETAAA